MIKTKQVQVNKFEQVKKIYIYLHLNKTPIISNYLTLAKINFFYQ